MVLPKSKDAIDRVNKLAQNLYINAPTLSQLSAVKAFDCCDELDQHVVKYKENRGIVLDSLRMMGFDLDVDVSPSDGAFYIYVDTSRFIKDSEKFCYELLDAAGVAITPGTDFEDPSGDIGKKRIRLSYCGSTTDVREGMRRISEYWRDNVLK